MKSIIFLLLGILVTIAATIIADSRTSESHRELKGNQQHILHNQQHILHKVGNSPHEHKTELEVKNESQNILRSHENSHITRTTYQNSDKNACRSRELRNWYEPWNNNRHKGWLRFDALRNQMQNSHVR